MTETEHVNRILCCYLRALSVRVSHHRVQRLLDTPVGGSLRGMSDALDALGVRNEVYQLPSREYFAQLEAPFIVGTDAAKRPFRAVTAVTDSEVVFADEKGKKRRMPTERFLSHWTGTVLLGEVTKETVSDPYARWKDVWFGCLKYKWLFGLLGVCLLGLASLYTRDCPPAGYACFFTEVFGMWVAAAILYKEHFDSGFLDRFCHIGQAVDCNRVLQSRGATLLGTGLGEWAMLYFTVFFLLGLMRPVEAYALTAAGCVAALGFTLYSVAYQAFVVRKACMLCLCVNVAVWGQATTLYALRDEVPFVFSPMGMAVFLLLGAVCVVVGLLAKGAWQAYRENSRLRMQVAGLYRPEAFRQLLALEPQAGDGQPCEAALRSGTGSVVTVITNPNCVNCAREHRNIRALAAQVPVSLVLVNYPQDRGGIQVSLAVIAAYRTAGWEQAMDVLQEWFDRKRLLPQVEASSDACVEVWREQQRYCQRQHVDRTPLALVDGRPVPECYAWEHLRYVLT